MFIFIPLDRHFRFCCCVVLFLFLFVSLWGVFSLFNHWFWHLHFLFVFVCFCFCFFVFVLLFVCLFFLKYVFFYRPISFKILMRISLFKFIFPLHTKLLWRDKWKKKAWIVPFFSHFNDKIFCFVCLFFRRLLPTQNLPQTSADL